MSDSQRDRMLAELAEGRTELVFDLIEGGCSASYKDEHGVSLIQHCAYYGDVSAIRFLLSHGESLSSIGENLGLDTACFHGHWRLCKFLLERGAEANHAAADTGETPLHRAAAFGEAETIRLLKDAGAVVDARDVHGETPLSWASWYGRPNPVLRELLYSNFRIHPQNQSMKANLLGKPLA